MNNNTPKYTPPKCIDPAHLTLSLSIGTQAMLDAVTVLENATIVADSLLENSSNSVMRDLSINKVILLQDTIQLARKITAQTANEMDVISAEETELALKEFETWQAQAQAAISTLANMGYTWSGGVLWRPPLGKTPDYILNADNPSAQEASHHG